MQNNIREKLYQPWGFQIKREGDKYCIQFDSKDSMVLQKRFLFPEITDYFNAATQDAVTYPVTTDNKYSSIEQQFLTDLEALLNHKSDNIALIASAFDYHLKRFISDHKKRSSHKKRKSHLFKGEDISLLSNQRKSFTNSSLAKKQGESVLALLREYYNAWFGATDLTVLKHRLEQLETRQIQPLVDNLIRAMNSRIFKKEESVQRNCYRFFNTAEEANGFALIKPLFRQWLLPMLEEKSIDPCLILCGLFRFRSYEDKTVRLILDALTRTVALQHMTSIDPEVQVENLHIFTIPFTAKELLSVRKFNESQEACLGMLIYQYFRNYANLTQNSILNSTYKETISAIGYLPGEPRKICVEFG